MGFFGLMAIASLIAGLVLVIKQPLTGYGLPRALEVGLGTLFIFVFMFEVFTVYLVPMIANEDMMSKSCNSSTLEMRCYNITQDSCVTVWETYKDRCDKEAKERIYPKNASALLGPTVKRCTRKAYDQSLKSARKFSENEDCKKLFSELDAQSAE